MYSQSSEVPLAPCSRDKNKYGNQGRCDTWVLPGKWQQVGGGVAWTSQICYLVWGMLVDSWDSTSEALFFSCLCFTGEQSSHGAAFDCKDFKKSSAAHLKGIRPDTQLLKKSNVILVVNADHDQSAAPLAAGSLVSPEYENLQFKAAFIYFLAFWGQKSSTTNWKTALPYCRPMLQFWQLLAWT